MSTLRYHNRVYVNIQYFGIKIHQDDVPTRNLADLGRTSWILGVANSALITSLQISTYDTGEHVRWSRRGMGLRHRLYRGDEPYESQMPHADGFPALKRVHVCGSRRAAHKIGMSDIRETLRLGFSKPDLVVSFDAVDAASGDNSERDLAQRVED